VKPGSRKESLRFENDVIVIQVREPAVDGKANDGLVSYLSVTLGIRKSEILIKSGHSARFKRIELPDGAAQKLLEIAKRVSG